MLEALGYTTEGVNDTVGAWRAEGPAFFPPFFSFLFLSPFRPKRHELMHHNCAHP